MNILADVQVDVGERVRTVLAAAAVEGGFEREAAACRQPIVVQARVYTSGVLFTWSDGLGSTLDHAIRMHGN